MREKGFMIKWWTRTVSAFGLAFGIATVFAGGSVLFGSDEARQSAGNYLPGVVWFNFIAGFFYITAGAALLRDKKWGMWLSLLILLGTASVSLMFIEHVVSGGAYEARTSYAMTFRTAIWAVISCSAWRYFSKAK